MIEWRFKPNSRDDMDVDPIQGEFFTTRDIDNISTAVIREGIQNALDERNRSDGNETVKLRIFLSGDKYSLSPTQYNPLFRTLMPHLQAKGAGINSLPDFTRNMKFFVFEDFNTKGLEGNPNETFMESNKTALAHNFYYFWRNVGRSGKTDDKLGRWGLGKTVFPASSLINTFWGITVRKSDQRKMLMGQSILRIHTTEDQHKQLRGYKPYGMFGNYDSDDYFALPVEDKRILSHFESLFHLQRKNDPGLSIIIPFCTDEISFDHLTYSVVEQYFYPVLEGKLEVEIIEEDTVILLDRSSIVESLEKINFQKIAETSEKKIKTKENLLKLFDFANWTFTAKEDDFYKLTELKLTLKPRWNKTLFSDEEKLNLLRDKFENGERIAFKIPLKYHPVGGTPKTCWYAAYLEKDTALSKPENLFVRDGITISGITSLEKGLARGVVIIHDIDLARMLGDSENPAHTEWQPDSRNFKGKYVDGKEALTFVKGTLKQLYDKLQRPLQGIQKDLLIDFFSIPVEAPEEVKQRDLPSRKEGGNNSAETEISDLNRRKRPFIIEKIRSGIKLYKNPDAEEIPDSLRLKLGYDVPRGNPIKSYQDLDFDVSKSPIRVEASGVHFIKKEKNDLEFNIENASYFEIVLTGFDEKRDLFLKTHQ